MSRNLKAALTAAVSTVGLLLSSPMPTAGQEIRLQAYHIWNLWICSGGCAGGYCCKIDIKPRLQ